MLDAYSITSQASLEAIKKMFNVRTKKEEVKMLCNRTEIIGYRTISKEN